MTVQMTHHIPDQLEYTGEISMTSSDERTMILRMIEEGKISVEEGARLLAALGEEPPVDTAAQIEPIGSGSRFLHVRVTDSVTGKQKVRVNIPTGLVSFGLRFVPNSAGFDTSAVQQAIDAGFVGQIADIQDDEDGNHVEIFIE